MIDFLEQEKERDMNMAVMSLRRLLFQRGVVRSDIGGSVSNGPYCVKLPVFGFKIIYLEGQQKLTLPFEIGLDGSLSIGTAYIQHWDNSSVPFQTGQITIIERNIFSALDGLQIRYTNVR